MGRPPGSKNKPKTGVHPTPAAVPTVPIAPPGIPQVAAVPPIPSIQPQGADCPVSPVYAPPPPTPSFGLSNSKADANLTVTGAKVEKEKEAVKPKAPKPPRVANKASAVALTVDSCYQCGRKLAETGVQTLAGKPGKEFSAFTVRIIEGPKGSVCSEQCLRSAQAGDKPTSQPQHAELGILSELTAMQPIALDTPSLPDAPDPMILPAEYMPLLGTMADFKPAVIEYRYVTEMRDALNDRRSAIAGQLLSQLQLTAGACGVQPISETASPEEKLKAPTGRLLGVYVVGKTVSLMRKRYQPVDQDTFKAKLLLCGVPGDVVAWAEKEATAEPTFSTFVEVR